MKAYTIMDIKIRLLTKEDTPQIYRLIESNRDRLRRYFPKTTGAIRDLNTAQLFVEQKMQQALRKELFFFVILYIENEIIGNVTIKNIDWTVPKCELSYFIDQAYEGKGYTSRVMPEIVKHCFEELGMEKLYLRIATENIASKSIAQKNGFIQEGLMRNEYRTGEGALIDIAYYGLLSSESASNEQASKEKFL